MTPYLTDNCIYYVLKYLQNFRPTLFNCILVNRFWCRTAIPFLYADPFGRNDKNDISNHYSIILTLISCFNKEAILQLNNQMKLIGINNVDIDDEYEPLFKYTKYMKNYYCIDSKIIEWFKCHLLNTRFPKDEIIENFCSIFHQSILNNCVNIERIIININSLMKFDSKFNIPASNLTKLNSLTLNNLKYLDQEIRKEFLNNIAVHCLNLKELIISSETRDSIITPVIIEGLCTIIQNQNNLEDFVVTNSRLNDNIFLSLEFRKDSLISIAFSRVDFSNISFKSFINLCNLNCLRFLGCTDLSPLSRYKILKFASFKLKRLGFGHNDWNRDIELIIIKYLGSSLQHLILCEKSITVPIIENVSIYCLKLITLGMVIGLNYGDLSVFPYFKNLKFSRLNINDIGSCDKSEMFRSLANNLSFNVKRIVFRCKCQQHFKIFLENCHNYLEKITLNHYFEGLEFLKIILNYIEKSNNGLRKLNIVGAGRLLNDEELKHLDEIHMKGVKIVTKL
ncbi:hypothetical protein RclHR1_08650002 [Rhizophagus clarus]|uniref:F-box domain-containing protein n=1 Tax=Rhizophagus clarus TaxID=94130 RepID=A0A2Z6SNV1_9GLOM|nr:hypothetical protein RclHR1_08650002 [Rhizophagus clarus]GES75691.1 hypothetical protein GLOIN_2v1774869 [Rhizophagus clarus]